MLYLSVPSIVDRSSSCKLTTSKIGITRLNFDIQTVIEVISKMKQKHVFKVSSTCAQQKDTCQDIDNDLKNDKSPDGPFLG